MPIVANRIFLSRDEPLEVRRKTTMDRLKYRAARDGKSVEIRDDQLYIENVAVYSMKLGLLRDDTSLHTNG